MYTLYDSTQRTEGHRLLSLSPMHTCLFCSSWLTLMTSYSFFRTHRACFYRKQTLKRDTDKCNAAERRPALAPCLNSRVDWSWDRQHGFHFWQCFWYLEVASPIDCNKSIIEMMSSQFFPAGALNVEGFRDFHLRDSQECSHFSAQKK